MAKWDEDGGITLKELLTSFDVEVPLPTWGPTEAALCDIGSSFRAELDESLYKPLEGDGGVVLAMVDREQKDRSGEKLPLTVSAAGALGAPLTNHALATLGYDGCTVQEASFVAVLAPKKKSQRAKSLYRSCNGLGHGAASGYTLGDDYTLVGLAERHRGPTGSVAWSDPEVYAIFQQNLPLHFPKNMTKNNTKSGTRRLLRIALNHGDKLPLELQTRAMMLRQNARIGPRPAPLIKKKRTSGARKPRKA